MEDRRGGEYAGYEYVLYARTQGIYRLPDAGLTRTSSRADSNQKFTIHHPPCGNNAASIEHGIGGERGEGLGKHEWIARQAGRRLRNNYAFRHIVNAGVCW